MRSLSLVALLLLSGCGAQAKWTWQGTYDCEMRDGSHRSIDTAEWTPFVGIGSDGWLENTRTHEQFDMSPKSIQWCHRT